MKINKKSIIFIILTIFVIFITPIQSRASTENYEAIKTSKIEKNEAIEKKITTKTFYIASEYNPIENPEKYEPSNPGQGDILIVTNKAGPIFNIITNIGIVTAVIVIIVIGIKYMIGSVEEKAEYKKTMVPYLIGAFMLASITVILKILAQIVSDIL